MHVFTVDGLLFFIYVGTKQVCAHDTVQFVCVCVGSSG